MLKDIAAQTNMLALNASIKLPGLEMQEKDLQLLPMR